MSLAVRYGATTNPVVPPGAKAMPGGSCYSRLDKVRDTGRIPVRLLASWACQRPTRPGAPAETDPEA